MWGRPDWAGPFVCGAPRGGKAVRFGLESSVRAQGGARQGDPFFDARKGTQVPFRGPSFLTMAGKAWLQARCVGAAGVNPAYSQHVFKMVS